MAVGGPSLRDSITVFSQTTSNMSQKSVDLTKEPLMTMWDDNQKQAHYLPAVPITKGLSNGRQQGELDFLDLPTSRRPFTSFPQLPTHSATVPPVKRFWHGLVGRRSSSSPPQQAIELQPIQERRFWKFSVVTPVTEVAAAHAKNGVVVGRSVPTRKKKKNTEKSHKPLTPQTHAGTNPLFTVY
ncbi:hypothetical protein PAXINDRAFT_13670 [Paxillus involutus ATCC 200175]|uniref:Uncharacterized protein n=1 Tax=Paxillus involutus ATCC 200175 TaxID=664439 RepID=A0A0C9TD86_PAXIN|nr:hypothetical protein PAXINDRAFT_13670 [Paxillus involutus ATCC 200175]